MLTIYVSTASGTISRLDRRLKHGGLPSLLPRMHSRIRFATFRHATAMACLKHAIALSVAFALCGTLPALAHSQSSSNTAPHPGALITPIQAGDRYFFAADSGTLYVRDGDNGPVRAILPAGTYGIVAPSRNGRYLAYTPALPPGTPPNTATRVRIRDVDTRADLSDVVDHAVITSAPWTDNHKGFFYAREDTSDHRQRVYYHTVGQMQSSDQIIYSRPDELDWRYAVRVSDDGHYAVFTVMHPQDDKTRIYVIDLDNPGKPSLNAPVVKLVDEFDSRYAFIDNGGQSIFLQTDRDAPHGKIVVANLDLTREALWPTVLREVADTMQYVRTAGDQYLIAVYRDGPKYIARVYSPPDPKQMREEMRKRADSTRKAGGDSTRRGGNGGYGGGGRRGGGGGGGMESGPGGMGRGPANLGKPQELLGFRLDLKGEIPIPQGAQLLGMNTLADKDELFYTVKLSDGSVRTYVYDVKKATNTPFNTSTSRS